jgi:hypothetical protein
MVIDAITELRKMRSVRSAGKATGALQLARALRLLPCVSARKWAQWVAVSGHSVFLPVNITFCPVLNPIRLASTFGEPSTFVIVRSS